MEPLAFIIQDMGRYGKQWSHLIFFIAVFELMLATAILKPKAFDLQGWCYLIESSQSILKHESQILNYVYVNNVEWLKS